MFASSLICLLLALIQCVLSEDPVVQTNYGPVRGYTSDIVNGKKANIFLGIPFAKPPIGNLRFEKPEKPEKWAETLDANRYSLACYPHHWTGLKDINDHSEDCLYLNVISPAEKIDGGYAVMVWIHGGGNNFGSASMIRIENVTDNFVSRDIVFVSIQYRLGPLGFLTSGDEVMPGNIGLWDQIAALKFVKENIGFFGGDPNRIVIFGLSSGGASTSALSLTPHAEDLFSGSIEMSGSVFAEWSSSQLVEEASLEVVTELKCKKADSEATKKCLKTKTPEEFLDAVDRAGRTRHGTKMVKFTPRVPSEFFPEPLETLVKKATRKPCIIGVTKEEGIFITLYPVSRALNSNYIKAEDYQNYTREKLVNFIRSGVATKKDFGKDALEVQERLIDFFAKSEDAKNEDYKHWLGKFAQLLSEIEFVIPAMLEAEIKVENDWPVWLYVTDYYNEANYDKDFPVKGATHGFEDYCMFHDEFFPNPAPFDKNDRKIQKAILDSLTNFAKSSNPSTKEFEWKEATKEHPWRNLRYRPNPVMEEKMFEESYKFWKSLENYDYNIIRGRSQSKTKSVRTEL